MLASELRKASGAASIRQRPEVVVGHRSFMPTASEIFSASLGRENWIGSFVQMNAMIDTRLIPQEEEGFDAFERLQGTSYWDQRYFFADVRNSADFNQRLLYLDKLRDQEHTLHRAGGTGLPFTVASAVFDPINWVPIGVGLASRAKTLPMLAGRMTGVGAAAAGLTEAGLSAMQPTRSYQESIANITGGALLMGGLGTAAGLIARKLRPELVHPRAFHREPLDEVTSSLGRRLEEGGEGKTPDELASEFAPELEAFRQQYPEMGAELQRAINLMLDDLAAGRMTAEEFMVAARAEVEKALPENLVGLGERAAQDLDAARRLSSAGTDAPINPHHQGDLEGSAPLVGYRPQPDPFRLVGFWTDFAEDASPQLGIDLVEFARSIGIADPERFIELARKVAEAEKSGELKVVDPVTGREMTALELMDQLESEGLERMGPEFSTRRGYTLEEIGDWQVLYDRTRAAIDQGVNDADLQWIDGVLRGDLRQPIDEPVSIHLDTPAAHSQMDGYVHGVAVDAIDHSRIADPDQLLDGSIAMTPDQRHRIKRLLEEKAFDELRNDGWQGYVHVIESNGARTREVVLFDPDVSIRKTSRSPARASQFRGLSIESLAELERSLGLLRAPIMGGSGPALLLDEYGLPVVSQQNFIEELEQASLSDFARLGNRERVDGRVNINTATLDDLLTLPGIGPKTAEKILDAVSRASGTTRTFESIEGMKQFFQSNKMGLSQANLDNLLAHLDVADQRIAPNTVGNRIKSAFGLEHIVAKLHISPIVRRLVNSRSEHALRVFSGLFETAGLSFDNDAVLRQAIPVETMIKRWDRQLVHGLRINQTGYLRYRDRMAGLETSSERNVLRATTEIARHDLAAVLKNPAALWDPEAKLPDGVLSPAEWDHRVGLAMFFGDDDAIARVHGRPGMEFMRFTEDIPEVGDTAREIRKHVINPMFERARELQLITDTDLNLVVGTGESYWHRTYNAEKIARQRDVFEREITNWMMESDPEMPRAQAEDAARYMAASILQSPAEIGSFSLFQQIRKTGTLRRRIFEVPDEILLPWLDLDVDSVMRSYVKTLAPDIELAAYLGRMRKEHTRIKSRRHIMDRERIHDPNQADDIVIATEREALKDARVLVKFGKERMEISKELEAQRHGRVDHPRHEIDAMKERVNELNREIEILQDRFRKSNERLGRQTADLLILIEKDEAGLSPWERQVGDFDALDFEVVKDYIREDYTRIRQKSIDEETFDQISVREKERRLEELNQQEQADLETFAELVEIMRNRSQGPVSPLMMGWTRANRFVRRWNVLTMGGGFAVSSLPDVGRLVGINGLTRFWGDFLDPVIRDAVERQKLMGTVDQLREFGVAWEIVLNNRASLMTEVTRSQRRSAMEGLTERGANAMFLLNLMSPWNDALKSVGALLTHFQIARIARAVSEGKPVKKADWEKMGRVGLDERMLRRIWKQMQDHSHDTVLDDIPMTNFADWVGDDPAAYQLYMDVMRREVDNLIVTPGVGDRPIIMSTEGAKTIFQFKSFAFAATTRVTMAAMQNPDKVVAQQFAVMHALGMMVYILKTLQYGGSLSSNPADWFAEGVDRAGIPGIFSEFDGIFAAMTGGSMSAARLIGANPPSRFNARQRVASMLFGPSYSRIDQASDLLDALVSGDMSPRDVQHIRNMFWLQNVFWADPLIDPIFNAWKKAVRNRPTKDSDFEASNPVQPDPGLTGVGFTEETTQ